MKASIGFIAAGILLAGLSAAWFIREWRRMGRGEWFTDWTGAR